MLQVRLNKAQYEYDIHSLVKAFYPTEEVRVDQGDKPEGIDANRGIMYISFEKETTTIC